jgi:hypothetical protein
MPTPPPPAPPASIREQIVLAVVAALGAATAPCAGVSGGIVSQPIGLTVHRERTRPIEIDSLPAILVYVDDDAPKTLAGQVFAAPLTERQASVSLECRAQGSASIPPDAALDPITVWAALAIFADERFGGLANGVEEGRTVWNSQEGDVPIASAKWSITVKFRTSRLDPTSKS